MINGSIYQVHKKNHSNKVVNNYNITIVITNFKHLTNIIFMIFISLKNGSFSLH